MKVVAISGSPNAKGNTQTAIDMVFEELRKEGIECETIQVGNKAFKSCMACGGCKKNPGKCAFGSDGLNEIIEKVREADGVILGSPIHFAGISGAMKCVCDRLGFVATNDPSILYHKVGTSVAAVRRTGGIAAFDCLNHYLAYCEMIIASSNYWNIIHGRTPGEAVQDAEGSQIMRVLGKNMAWLLKMREQGLDMAPEREAKVLMNFIR